MRDKGEIERITIQVSHARMSVRPYGFFDGQRPAYYCGTLEIFVVVATGVHPQWPLIDNLALNEAVSRHIPAIEVKRWKRGVSGDKRDKATKEAHSKTERLL